MSVDIQEIIKAIVYAFLVWFFANVAVICAAVVWIVRQIIKYHDLNKKVAELDSKSIKFEKDINGIGAKVREFKK